MWASETQNSQFSDLHKPPPFNDDAIPTTATFYEPVSVLDPRLSSSLKLSDIATVPDLPIETWNPHPTDNWDPRFWLVNGGGDEEVDPAIELKPPPDHRFALDPHASIPFHHSLIPHPHSIDPQPSHLATNLDTFFCNPAAPVLSEPVNLPAAFEQLHLDQLIRAAEALESNDLSLAGVILAQLSHQLALPMGRPIQRAAYYFREALQSLLSFLEYTIMEPLPSPVEIVDRISAFKTFSDLTPFPHYASFTVNQAFLEALEGSRAVHLIDFDLGFGGLCSSLMHEIATRCRAARAPLPSVRLTAVVRDESLQTTLTGENLREFARGLGLHFSIDFVRVGDLGSFALRSIRQEDGESVAVSFSPAIFRLLGSSPECFAEFLSFVRRVSPRAAAFVDVACGCGSTHSVTPSFHRSFKRELEVITVIMESFEATAAAVGIGHDQVSRIERLVLLPKLRASVGSLGKCDVLWKELFECFGMRPVQFSEFTESQTEGLTRLTGMHGFHLARREGSIVLSWQGKELLVTWAWKR